MSACLQEDCANWDGHACPCAVLDLEPVDVREHYGFDGAPEKSDLRTPPAHGCANYAAPVTCLTAPSSVTGRCDHCKEQA